MFGRAVREAEFELDRTSIKVYSLLKNVSFQAFMKQKIYFFLTQHNFQTTSFLNFCYFSFFGIASNFSHLVET